MTFELLAMTCNRSFNKPIFIQFLDGLNHESQNVISFHLVAHTKLFLVAIACKYLQVSYCGASLLLKPAHDTWHAKTAFSCKVCHGLKCSKVFDTCCSHINILNL